MTLNAESMAIEQFGLPKVLAMQQAFKASPFTKFGYCEGRNVPPFLMGQGFVISENQKKNFLAGLGHHKATITTVLAW